MPAAADPNRPLSVLVIEDVADTANTLAEFLRTACGYEVAVAYDGETGLKRAVADRPDVVVCDIGLPRLDGFKVAQQITDRVSPKPFLIAITAYGGTFRREQAMQVFDHYLTKPADPHTVAGLIESHRRIE
ncbi:MAG TPA: response regulator [Gemmataceae bacterium]|nr:response regulator [Gemmataceae bacterium]